MSKSQDDKEYTMFICRRLEHTMEEHKSRGEKKGAPCMLLAKEMNEHANSF